MIRPVVMLETTRPPTIAIDIRPAWVGLIPFRMVDAGVGRGRAVPWLGTFLETNVRLYSVDPAGRRGVVFRSLEAERLAVVAGANATFNVPYKWAAMSYDEQGDRRTYRTRRRTPSAPTSPAAGPDSVPPPGPAPGGSPGAGS